MAVCISAHQVTACVPVPPPLLLLLLLLAGSKSFGHSCRLSADGRVALVTDAARGAMVYQREVHTPRGSAVSAAAAYRAAGWLAGAPARERYQVVAADLGPSGRQAVLLVQGVRPSTWSSSGSSYAALKVFAGEPLGEWTAVCSIDLNTTASTTTSMTLQTGVVQDCCCVQLSWVWSCTHVAC